MGRSVQFPDFMTAEEAERYARARWPDATITEKRSIPLPYID